MSALVLVLGAGGGRDAAAGPEAPESVPAFTYEQYSDAQGHFTYDGAALKLVKRPAHLARVHEDAERRDARAMELVRELEHWFHQAGLAVADATTRPACLPLPELTPECQPNWQFLNEFLGDTREAQRLRQVVADAYEVRARERGLKNKVIVAGVNLLLAGGIAKGFMKQAVAAEGTLRFGADDLVLGMNQGGSLKTWAARTGGRTLGQFELPAGSFDIQIRAAMDRAPSIRFNLTGVDVSRASGALSEFGEPLGGYTNYELYLLKTNPQYLGKTTFHVNDVVVPSPF